MNRNNYLYIEIFIVIILFILALTLCPWNTEFVYLNNYITDWICFSVILLLVFRYINRHEFNMFDPFFLITVIYSFLYFITPIHDIISKNYLWYGYNLFPSGVKATIIATIGYISFYIAYNVHYKSKKRSDYFVNACRKDHSSETTEAKERKIPVILILLMFFICLLANIWYLMRSGFYSGNFLYIISFGILGSNENSLSTLGSIGFVSMLAYSLPTTVLLYWEYGNSRVLKIILFIPMMMLQITRGFRFFIIQIGITFIAYYYIRKNKRLTLKKFAILSLCIIIPVLLMTIFRTSIRNGTGVDFSNITFKIIEDSFNASFWENFRIYRNFYGMVDVIPSQYGYVYGRQIILGTLVMIIPRLLWPGKISSYGGVGLRKIIGGNIGSGQAYPTVGELYYAMGVFGVVMGMVIHARWMMNAKQKLMTSRDELNFIEFTVLLGCNLQLMIRGYFPSNFWLIIFSLIPIWICKIFVKSKSDKTISTEKG